MIPIVLYHGTSRWNIGMRLSDAIDLPDKTLKQYVPDFKYILVDLNHIPDKKINGTNKLKLGLILLKHVFDRTTELYKVLDKNDHLVKEIWNQGHQNLFLEAAVRYLFTTDLSKYDVQILFEKAIPKNGGDLVMSTAEKLWKAGKQEGKLEGKLEGKKEIAKTMIKKGIEINLVAEVTGLSMEEVKSLAKDIP